MSLFAGKRRRVILLVMLFSMVSVILACAPAKPADQVPATTVITDSIKREVKVPTKVNRVVSLMKECTTIVFTLGAGNRLVGLDNDSVAYYPYKKFWLDKNPVPSVGRTQEPNIEQIVALKPDVILFWGGYGEQQANEIQQRTGVPVICLHSYTTIEGMEASYRMMGKLLGLEQRAEELLTYAKGKLDHIAKRTSKVTNRPRVHLLFWFFWNGVSRIPIFYDPVEIAGGVNIARGMDPNVYGYSVKVPVEQVVAWQPDVIFIHGYPAKPNVSVETVLKDPRMKETPAIKSRRVYYTLGMSSGWHYDRVLTETTYMAKLLHPQLFNDIDPRKEGDEIFQKFYGVPGLWTDYGNSEGWIEYYAKLGL